MRRVNLRAALWGAILVAVQGLRSERFPDLCRITWLRTTSLGSLINRRIHRQFIPVVPGGIVLSPSWYCLFVSLKAAALEQSPGLFILTEAQTLVRSLCYFIYVSVKWCFKDHYLCLSPLCSPCSSVVTVSTCWRVETEVWCPSGRSTTSTSCSPILAVTLGSAPWPCHMTKGTEHTHSNSNVVFFFLVIRSHWNIAFPRPLP